MQPHVDISRLRVGGTELGQHGSIAASWSTRQISSVLKALGASAFPKSLFLQYAHMLMAACMHISCYIYIYTHTHIDDRNRTQK